MPDLISKAMRKDNGVLKMSNVIHLVTKFAICALLAGLLTFLTNQVGIILEIDLLNGWAFFHALILPIFFLYFGLSVYSIDYYLRYVGIKSEDSDDTSAGAPYLFSALFLVSFGFVIPFIGIGGAILGTHSVFWYRNHAKSKGRLLAITITVLGILQLLFVVGATILGLKLRIS
jgi:hypothetical protein